MLYWTIAVPRLTYGLELIDLPGPAIQTLETVHGRVAKTIQGLPRQTVNCGCLAPLGWLSMESFLDYMQMIMFWRILTLPVSCIYKQVMILRLCNHLFGTERSHCGPVWYALQTFIKYKLIHHITTALCTGIFMSVIKMKCILKSKIKVIEVARSVITYHLYKNVFYVRECYINAGMWSLWLFTKHAPAYTKRVRVVARLVFEETCLRKSTSRYSKDSPLCCVCNCGDVEDTCHLLFECSETETIRSLLWLKVTNEMPPQMQTHVEMMSSKQKCVFILSGLNTTFTYEWCRIYKAAIDFIYTLYKKRRALQTFGH